MKQKKSHKHYYLAKVVIETFLVLLNSSRTIHINNLIIK